MDTTIGFLVYERTTNVVTLVYRASLKRTVEEINEKIASTPAKLIPAIFIETRIEQWQQKIDLRSH